MRVGAAVPSQVWSNTGVERVSTTSDQPARRPVIALVSPWHPEPTDNGSKHRLRRLIDTFSDEYDVFLIVLQSDTDGSPEIHGQVPGVWRLTVLPIPNFRPRSLRSIAASLHPYPRSFVATWDQEIAKAISAEVRTAQAHLVIGTDLRIVRYLQSIDPKTPVILDEANVSPFVGMSTDRSPSALRAMVRERKYQRLLNARRTIEVVVVPSRQEAIAYQSLAPSSAVQVIPNGVGAVPATPWQPPGTEVLLYTGSLTYGPNLEAVTWYERAILPLLKTQLACPVLHITGALPDAIPDRIKQPAFRLTGRLDDLDPMFRASGVFVAPILSGTGTRIKILEALAYGIPIVTTSKGCEGIPLVPGRHALIADTPADFALAILRVLQNPGFAMELGASGRAFVQQHGTWDKSAEQFLTIVANLLKQER